MLQFILALVEIGPWAQFGLAGVTFITLATMLWRIMKRFEERDKSVVDIKFATAARKQMLEEIEKREIRLAELQEKTLEALYKNMTITEKLIMRLEDIEDVIEDKYGN